jgi:2-oxo-4-hydroxy-4-carboxy-5-ureidoimidazoline decarboxylase
MSSPLAIADINALDAAAFVARFGDVAEHSPWVAAGAAALRPFASREDMIAAFVATMENAAAEARLALIRAHPDLAGKAAIAGDLAEDSRREQAGAGLDRLTAEEFARFTELNVRYLARFGFPFIFAVKGAGKAAILAAFEARLHNDAATELATALTQIARIFRFRIEDRVQP